MLRESRNAILTYADPLSSPASAGFFIAGRLSDRPLKRLIIVTRQRSSSAFVGSALSPSAAVLVFFRVIIGLGVGSASVTVPLYVGELAPPGVRGALVSLNQLAITLFTSAGGRVSQRPA